MLKPPSTLAAGDHAFANGFAFEDVATPEAALAALRARIAVVDERDAALLAAVWRQFREGAELGANVRLALGARLINLGARSNARLLGDSVIRGTLRLEAQGRLDLGRFCYVGDGVIVSAQAHVTIGEATLLAHGVQVFDNNSHPISAAARELQFRRMMGFKERNGPIIIDAAPVQIGRRCWIGANALVMKGVTIGDDTIVAAGSVVSTSLPEGVIAGGNPAKTIRVLTAEERATAVAQTN
jgi:acetyltransferase-like isoleucine patch superfamily enzyme